MLIQAARFKVLVHIEVLVQAEISITELMEYVSCEEGAHIPDR